MTSSLSGPAWDYSTDPRGTDRAPRKRKDRRKMSSSELLLNMVSKGQRPLVSSARHWLGLQYDDDVIAVVADEDTLGLDKSKKAWRVVPVEEEIALDVDPFARCPIEEEIEVLQRALKGAKYRLKQNKGKGNEEPT